MGKHRGALPALLAVVVALACGGDDSGGAAPDGGPGVDGGGAAGDTTAPRVISVSPVDGATGVDDGITIEVVWDEALDPATVGAPTFDLAPTPYESIAYDDASRTVTLTTSKPYLPGSLYQLSISGVADPAGNVAADFSSSFTTSASAIGRIDTGGAATHGGAVMAFDDDGNGVAAWKIDTGIGAPTVVVSFYTAATSSWSSETAVTTTAGALQLASNGDTFMLVAQGDGYLITYDSGSGWTIGSAADVGLSSIDGLLSNGTTYLAYYRFGTSVAIYDGSWTIHAVATDTPLTAATDGVTYAVAWEDGGDLFFSAFLDGSWTAAELVDSDSDFVRDQAMVGAYGGGAFIITWEQDQTGSASSIDERWAAHYGYSGTVVTGSTATVLDINRSDAALTANSTGYFVAWATELNTVTVAMSSNGTVWSLSDVFIGDRVTSSGDIVIASDHSRVVVGIRDGLTDENIYVALYRNAAWETAVQLSSAVGSKENLMVAGHADSATAGNNRLAVSWTTDQVPGRVMLATSPTSVTAVDSAVRQNGDPYLAAGAAGVALAWGQDDGLWASLEGSAALELAQGSYQADAESSRLSASDTGLRVSAWVQGVGWGEEILTRVSASSTWGDVTSASGALALGSVQELGLTASGDTAMLVWSVGREIFTAYFDGSSWQPPSSHGDGSRDPHVLVTGAGYALVWHRDPPSAPEATGSGISYGGSATREVVLKSFSGGIWGAEDVLNVGPEPSRFGALAGPAGVAIYADPADNGSELVAAIHSGDTWSSLQLLDSSLDSNPEVQLVATSDGFGYLWRDNGNLDFVAVTGSTFGSPTTLTTTENGDRQLHLRSDGTGFLAVWTDVDDTTVYRAVSDGSSWGSPETVPSESTSESLQVAAVGSGYLMVYPNASGELIGEVREGGSWSSAVVGTGVDLLSSTATPEGTYLLAITSESASQAGFYELELIAYDGGWQSTGVLITQDGALFEELVLEPAPGSSAAFSWETNLGNETELWGTTGVPH